MNGTSVVGHKHGEVVDMIRDSSFVTLTLIGKLGTNGTAKGIHIHTLYMHQCTVDRDIFDIKNFSTVILCRTFTPIYYSGTSDRLSSKIF